MSPRQPAGAIDDEAALDGVLRRIAPLDEHAMTEASAHLDRMTKPPGSLGRLELVVIALAGITGVNDARATRRSIIVAAGDHGVTRRGVSAYPADVTAQMVANFVHGGAAINALAATVGARIVVVDVGVATAIRTRRGPHATGGRLVRARIRDGTADMTDGPAMTRADALRAIHVGMVQGARLAGGRDGDDLVGIGEMGIGNTTAASAITAVMTGAPIERVTGRGTGIDDATRERKVSAIERAILVNRPDRADPVGVLAAVGGLEIAALVGVIVSAAALHIPVVLDGFITGSAALIAAALEPRVATRCIASHVSMEPGHAVILDRLGLTPLLSLDLRLGEGTGAALGMGVILAAIAVRDGMATFESAAISGPVGPGPV